MKKLVAILFGGLTVLALGCLAPVPAQNLAIGYVDFGAFSTKSKKMQAAQQDLMKLAESKKQEFERMQQDYLNMEQDLRKQGPLLKEQERNQKIAELAKKKAEIELFQKQTEQQLQNEQRDRMQTLQKQLKEIVDKIRKDKKLTLIFDSAALVSVDQALDVTDAAANEFDASAAAVTPASKPGPTAPGATKPPAAGPAPAPAPAKKPAPNR